MPGGIKESDWWVQQAEHCSDPCNFVIRMEKEIEKKNKQREEGTRRATERKKRATSRQNTRTGKREWKKKGLEYLWELRRRNGEDRRETKTGLSLFTTRFKMGGR